VPSHFNWPLHCYRPTRLLPQNSVIFPVIILRASKLIHHLHKTNQIIFNTILTGSSSQIIYIYIQNKFREPPQSLKPLSYKHFLIMSSNTALRMKRVCPYEHHVFLHLPIKIPHVKQIYININSVKFSMTVATQLSSICPFPSDCITSVPDKQISSNKLISRCNQKIDEHMSSN